MTRDIDLSKPLSEEQIADLKSRLPLETVNHYVALANGQEAAEELAAEDDKIEEYDEERLQLVAHKLAEVLDQLEARAEALGVELEAFPADEPDEGGASQDGPFDPGAHTPTKVLEYLMTADAEETQRVLAAEKAGKNRSKIFEQA